MPKISPDTLNNVKSMLARKCSVREIERITGVSKSSVQRIASQTGNKPGGVGGRPKKLNDRIVTSSIIQLTSGKVKTAESLAKALSHDHGINVHRTTLSRALHRAGMGATEKKKKPALSAKNVKERLSFAKSHNDWTVEDWKTVIFSDETKINRFNSDGRTWTWVREGESLQPRNVYQTTKHGGGGLMLWGCITSKGVGYLCEIEGTMDQHLYKQILEGELQNTIDYYELDPGTLIFQHDNDPKHTAKSVKEWLNEQEFKVLTWPPQSPDLNPIEHAWAYLKQQLNKYDKPPNGMRQLWERIQEEWEKISLEYINNLFNSMPSRMRAVIKAKGRWTKY